MSTFPSSPLTQPITLLHLLCLDEFERNVLKRSASFLSSDLPGIAAMFSISAAHESDTAPDLLIFKHHIRLHQMAALASAVNYSSFSFKC